MRIGQKIQHPAYGVLTVKSKKYSPLRNEIVWVLTDKYGSEYELTQAEILNLPVAKEENLDSFAKMAKALDIQKGEKGDKGDSPIPGVDYYTKRQLQAMVNRLVKTGLPVKGVDYWTKKDIDDVLKKSTPIKGKDYFDGKDGKTPVYGKDYFTREQIKSFILLAVDQVRKMVKDGGKFVGNFKTENDLPEPEREGDWAYVENTGRIWYT